MDKPALTELPLLEPIGKRWSPRAFAERPVEDEKLCLLFEAARWTASSRNEQPWRYLVARRQDAAAFARMLDCLVPSNQDWAQRAGALILTVAKLAFDYKQLPNLHAYHDVGQASAAMAIQATALGLFIHQMAGFEPARAIETYGIPEGFYPVSAIAVGYPGDPALLSEKQQAWELAPRKRRPLVEIVFADSWGSSAEFDGP